MNKEIVTETLKAKLKINYVEHMSKKEFANMCINVRERHGLNQRMLAELVGTTQATISRWELAETMPTSDAVEKIKILLKEDPAHAGKFNSSYLLRKHDLPKVDKITLRDQFAMSALNGLLAGRGSSERTTWAEVAYEFADAMMEARSALEEKE